MGITVLTLRGLDIVGVNEGLEASRLKLQTRAFKDLGLTIQTLDGICAAHPHATLVEDDRSPFAGNYQIQNQATFYVCPECRNEGEPNPARAYLCPTCEGYVAGVPVPSRAEPMPLPIDRRGLLSGHEGVEYQCAHCHTLVSVQKESQS